MIKSIYGNTLQRDETEEEEPQILFLQVARNG